MAEVAAFLAPTASSTAGTSNGLVWRSWVNNVSCSTTAATTVWPIWAAAGTTSATSATAINVNDTAWNGWITNCTQTIVREHKPGESWRQRVEALMTPEERAQQEQERQEREDARRIEREQKIKAREAAIFKAERLLRSCLTAEQEATLDKHRYFEVRGGRTGTKYRIRRGRHINIEVLGKGGAPVRKLCFAPRVDCPDADAMLCQKLMLELDEDAALKVAVKHGTRTNVLQGHGDLIVPRERREEILAEVIPIDRANAA